MSQRASSDEKTPLVPTAASAASGAPSSSSYDARQAPSRAVRIGLDTAVVKAQQKWKRLAEIDDDNCTAKDMASEMRHEFEALQQQQQHRRDAVALEIPEGDEDDDEPDYDHDHEGLARGDSELEQAKSILAESQVDKFLIAATFVRDGIHGRKIGCSLDRTSLYLHELFHAGSYRFMYTVVVLVNCALAFAERPGEQNVYLLVDLLCLAVFAVDVYIRWYMSSAETQRKYLTRQPWAVARMMLLAVTFVDLVTNLLLPAWNPYRYSRMLRPFFLITRRRNIRIIFASCVRALREVLIVLLLSFCLIGFFGLLGYLLFSDLSNATGAPFFGSLHSSLYTMLLIHNCLPYMVKSMYPYFIVTEWSALFFVVFVLLTNMFLAKLTIAVSYKSYKQHTEKMLFKRLQKRKAALYAAFDILAADVQIVDEEDDEMLRTVPTFLSKPASSERRGSSRFFGSSVLGNTASKRGSFAQAMTSITPIKRRCISLETWISLCEYLRPKWTSVESALVFNTIDIEHIGYVDLGDFYQLCSLISVKLEKMKPSAAAAILQCFIPSLKRHTVRRWQLRMREYLLYEKIFFGKYPVVISELVVGLLIMLSVVQAIQVNDIELAFSVNKSWRIVGFVLLCIFSLEVVAKLFAFGRREFFSRPFCRLDLGIVVVGWMFYAITFKDSSNVSRVFYDLSLAVRSLRILKLLNLFPPFHEILWTMQRILPLIVQLLLVIFSFMYAFAIVTQANYGIALREFPAEKASLSPNWYNVRQEFQVDTFAETLVTLFGVANLAGWDMVMDAAHAITGSDATYVYFFSYRIAMANILLPIFVGFLVESFVSNAKSVENTIETYVEAASVQMRQQEMEDATLPPPEEEQLALMASKLDLGGADAVFTPPSKRPTANSPVSMSSDGRGGDFRFRFARSGSLVQGEMFDAVKLSDVSRLKLMVEKKDEEVARQEADIRKLEGNVLAMQTRLNQSQRIILAYERKMEELNTQLKDAQANLLQRDQRGGLTRKQSSRRQQNPPASQ
jgi:hypothetical protein